MVNGSALHPLVQRLAREGVLRCPRCGKPEVGDDGEVFICAACDTRFPIYNRVADLHGLVAGSPASERDVDAAVALARPVAHALDLPDSEAMNAAISDVLRRTALMSAHHDEFDAEIRDIADRFGIDAGVPRQSVAVATPPAPQVLDVRVERHYIPEQLPPGVRVTCNVRFRNEGSESFSSVSDPPVTVGFRWFDADEHLVLVPERRTRFPITMTPGRAVTLPVELETPPHEGAYTLVICPVIEFRCWVPESGLAVPVTVQTRLEPPHTVDVQVDAQPLTYAEDHEVARRMLEERAAYLLASPGRRILEIGGGASPQISWFGAHDAVNVDINLPLLELGSLWYDHHAYEVSERLAFLCADATDLPFESETFDIVAMFGTLHHFPEPEVLMRECRRLVRPDGLISVMCEPVGETLELGDTLRDLEKGINEQVFTLAEYVAIFAAAGLEPAAGNQAGGSLRVLLRRTAESGASFTRVTAVSPSLLSQLRPAPSALERTWIALKRRVREHI